MKDLNHINTKILGLIGHPIKHSYSPYIHNLTAELLGFDCIYLPFDVPASDLRNALRGMTALDILGFNITIPHKESIIQFLNEISEEASIIGSVNTIVNDHGKLTGYNTDVNGVFETLIPYNEEINGEVITIVGAGGSARAVIYTLIRHFKPKVINLINRTLQRAESLREYFSEKMKFDSFNTFELFPPVLVDVLKNSKLIINATSIGMHPDIDDTLTEINKSFNENQIIFDLVYNPTETKLLKIASKQGALTINGIKMLVLQAAKSFDLWTEQTMPTEKIEKALQLYIKN